MKTIADLYLHLLRDMYYAEKQVVKALPKAAKLVKNKKLNESLKSHVIETKMQIERLDHVLTALNSHKKSERCFAMDGLLTEADELMTNAVDDDTRDAAIIAACRKIEHYEIGSYSTLIEMAKLLGHTDQVKILRDTLKEEKAADVTLSALSDAILQAGTSDIAKPHIQKS